MQKHKILLIDDCEEIGALIKSGMTSYAVDQSTSIADARDRLQRDHSYRLLLIDVSLPDGNGFDFCAQLSSNAQYEKIHKILLTAKSQMAEKVYGFSCGADDYITKPCNMMELKARVDRYLQKKEQIQASILSHPPFEFHLEYQKCYISENQKKTDLGLTPTEFRLFLALIRSEDRVLTRQELELQVWKAHGVSIEPRGVDTHIAHLREKLKSMKIYIVSVYGQGYSFSRNQEAA